MRTFNVVVNGTSYEVGVEEVGSVATPSVAPVAPVAVAPKTAPVAVSAPKVATAPVAVGNGTPVNAPMPGVVLKFAVKEGDAVKAGQAVLVLEAMKMENDIAAPCDGKISFKVSQGATVESGAILAVIA